MGLFDSIRPKRQPEQVQAGQDSTLTEVQKAALVVLESVLSVDTLPHDAKMIAPLVIAGARQKLASSTDEQIIETVCKIKTIVDDLHTKITGE